jgi:hypothetical protein
MINKNRYTFFLIPFLAFISACKQETTVLSTETLISKTISPTPVPTSTALPVTVPPSPLPTEPIIPAITPNVTQIERWNEYEDALAKAFFKSFLRPEEVVCEWEILGQTEQEVYVYAHCAGIYSATPSQASIPAVIHIEANGAVTSAEIPGAGTSYAPDIRQMFPPDVQERIFIQPVNYIGTDAYRRAIERADRLRWRRGHPDEPPWIVISALGIEPTPAVIRWVTPDTVQVERWKEYQTLLAGEFNYRPPEEVICEWEFLGRSVTEVYVWAICGAINGYNIGLEGLAVVYVGEDGSVIRVDGQANFPSEIRDVYPADVQERYFSGSIHFQELIDRLRWRQRNRPDELPLIALNSIHTP